MPWDNSPEKRRRDAEVYGDPEYKRNRAIVRRRSGGRCELIEAGRRCSSRDRVQTDHIVPVSQGGTHALSNLRDLCKRHHAAKTAQEGAGYRAKSDPELQPRTAW
jgi:5-methylcytosine-specific restriction enzyme A